MPERLRKVTVNIPAQILENATRLTGKGITPTIIEGLHELERRAKRSALRGLRGKAAEEAKLQRRREIEDFVPDRDTAARSAARRREHAKRQVLDREFGMLVRRGDPAASLGAVRIIDHVKTARAR